MMAPRAEKWNGYIYVPLLSGSKELLSLSWEEYKDMDMEAIHIVAWVAVRREGDNIWKLQGQSVNLTNKMQLTLTKPDCEIDYMFPECTHFVFICLHL